MVKNERLEITPRNHWIQCVRGICILAVILIHCPSGFAYQGVPGQQWQFWEWVTVRQFVNFAVGVFVFLSGYLVKKEKVENNPFRYIKQRCLRLLIPMYTWSLFYTAANIYSNWPDVNALKLAVQFITGRSCGPFYFILVMVQLTLLTPVITFVRRKCTYAKYLLWMVTPIWLLAQYIYTFTYGAQIPQCEYFFPTWFLQYYAGIWFREKEKENKMPNVKMWMLLAALMANLTEGYLLYLHTNTGTFGTSQIRGGVVLYATIMAMFLLSNKQKECPWLAKVGDNSFGIYFCHMLPMMLLQKLIQGSIITKQIVCFVVTLCISMIMCDIVRRILGGKRAKFWLGV